jgi:hypothetical protein
MNKIAIKLDSVLFQHLIESMNYETMKPVQGDIWEVLGQPAVPFFCLDVNGRFFRFEEKFPDTASAEAVIRSFRGSGYLNRILMDDILILLCISSFICHIPAKGLKKWVYKFSSELSFVISRTMVGFDVTFKAFDEVGYLFQGFFFVRGKSIIVFWKEGVKEKSLSLVVGGFLLLEVGEEELDFCLAKGFLNFDCLLGKKSSHLICMEKPF